MRDPVRLVTVIAASPAALDELEKSRLLPRPGPATTPTLDRQSREILQGDQSLDELCRCAR